MRNLLGVGAGTAIGGVAALLVAMGGHTGTVGCMGNRANKVVAEFYGLLEAHLEHNRDRAPKGARTL